MEKKKTDSDIFIDPRGKKYIDIAPPKRSKKNNMLQTGLTMEEGEEFALGMMRAYVKLMLKSLVVALGILLIIALIDGLL